MKWHRGECRFKAGLSIALMACVTCATADVLTFPTISSLPTLAFPATISVGRNAATGTSLSAINMNVGLAVSGVTCPIQKTVTINGTPDPGVANAFQTGVPGIGVRYYITYAYNNGFVLVPITQTFSRQDGNTQHYVQADLVVTGPVGSGTISALPAMTITFSGSCFTTAQYVWQISGISQVVSNTCSVTTPALTFELPKAFSTALTSAGATTGTTTTQLGLDCAAGVKIAVTITDAINPANRSTTLSLTSDSSAAGVGLQILNGSTPIAFGPDSATAGTVNQWVAGTAAGGPIQIPLSARYIRTTGTLIPGSVKGMATFTMSYQ